MLSVIYELMSKYDADKVHLCTNPYFIRSLKLLIGEGSYNDKLIAGYRSEGLDDKLESEHAACFCQL
jgi:hypothetical protein